MKIFILVLVIVLGYVCVGCQNTDSNSVAGTDSLLGKWQHVTNGESLEFFPDGTLVIVRGDDRWSGRFERLDDENLSIRLTGFWGGDAPVEIWQYRISGDILTLDAEGIGERFTRIP